MDSIGSPNKRNNNIGAPFSSGLSSDDDFDDVVIRNPRHSSVLLADEGDGSEADLLGTTPPRSRIRNKERRRANIDSDLFSQKVRLTKRNSDSVLKPDPSGTTGDRFRKRSSLKLVRSRERDFKQDMSQQREQRGESMPPPVGGATPAVPTLVESCSRFMSLTSKLKRCTASPPDPEVEERRWLPPPEELPPSRVSFHNTFSMLINMGNIEKGCRRTISREEQVWQNELKDLIWLELQAKIAGRSLAQQDSCLCTQRNVVPYVVQNIIDYRFVNTNPCRSREKRLGAVEGSREDLTSDETKDDSAIENEQDEEGVGCLLFNCRECADAVGKAMREVNTLLDSYYNAVSLYPSCKAMTVDHPLTATQLFKNRIKAMCLWYNTALHMRLKMLAVRRMLRSLRHKRRSSHSPSVDSGLSRQSSETRPCKVRFNMNSNPSDSSNSESSVHSEQSKDDGTKDSGHGLSENSDGREDAKDDEVDCALATSDASDHNGQLTPEIVISDSKYSSSDTHASSESGFESCGAEAEPCDVYALGSLDDLTRLRLLGRCKVSPYREFHVEVLKTQGVRRSMMFIDKLRKNLLIKVYQTLEKPDSENPDEFQESDAAEMFHDTKDDEDKTESLKEDDLNNAYERKRFGCWSEESVAMRLPSYRSHFLALSSLCMEAVHDYLSLRLESRPDRPSCLTVKQLITELKEGLDISTGVRRDFVRHVAAALRWRPAPAGARRDLLLLLRSYDTTVEAVLTQYLSYLKTMAGTEVLGRSCLQQEWAFTARLARRVQCAAVLAPSTFSDIACSQIDILLKEFFKEFNEIIEMEKTAKPNNKYTAYEICRTVQDIYARWREPLLHTAQWARALAAKLARAHSPACTPLREKILNKLIKMRDFIATQTEMVLQRSQVPDEDLERYEGLFTRMREMLLQMFKLGFELHKELFKLVAPPTSPDRSTRRLRPASMQPLRSLERPPGRRPRPETIIVHEILNPVIHKEIHRAVTEAPRPACARRSAVNSPPKLRHKFARSESVNEDAVLDDKLFETLNNYGEDHAEVYIERLLWGSEAPHAPAAGAAGAAPAAGAEEAEREWARRVARAVVDFARCWMRFVVERCDTGRGLRPRWASQGLEFLMLACDPCNTKHLSEEEFEELKQLMDGCISHVVGSRPAPRAGDAHAHTPRARPRLHSPSPGSPQSTGPRDVPPPPTPPSEPDPLLSFNGHEAQLQGHKQRVLRAIEQLEEHRDEKLREMKMLGRVAQHAVASYEPKLRQLTFKWQRGLKIGAGTFGKVYTVVNTESGQLLAMKELNIGAGDRRALQRAANELRVLEGVIHPHLVRYYGCELHREEMLLFMELCVEGSLEALVATAGALAERPARRYARQLRAAVAELHSRNIVHRDIKSGNIFLTNEGHCLKLGDFGCAVKIRANTTAPGELQGFVGTQAYMAPEVFMKSEGHGRAADIWSFGCVITEMASGKRPFSEYDSNYQIMFVVGMGGRPEVPDTLSEEGRDFCRRCLTHDPDLRPRADELAMHHFLMVRDDDEDCKCEAAFLKT